MNHRNDTQDLPLFDMKLKQIYDKQGNKHHEHLNL